MYGFFAMAKIEELNFSNHIIATSASDIRVLADPLKKFNIQHFSLVRRYPDNSCIVLTTHPRVSEHYWKYKYYTQGLYGDFELYRSVNLLWSSAHSFKFFHDLRDSFGIDNGIAIIKKSLTYCDFFYFATTPNNYKIVNFYLNNLDFLESFIQMFLENGGSIIEMAEKDKFIYQNANKKDIIILDTIDYLTCTSMSKALENKCKQLTKREFECAHYLCLGYSAKEIARIMNLSHRTVEKHISSILKKTHSETKAKLVAQYASLASNLGSSFSDA